MRGALVTYKNGEAIGGERWRREGEALTSDVTLGGRTLRVTLTREAARVEASGAAPTVRPIAADEVALENGSWQAYALAAERFASAREPAPVNVVVPSRGAVVRGTIAVRPTGEGAREVVVHAGPLVVEVTIDGDGRVRRARVPAQGLEARGEGEEAPAAEVSAPRPPPEGVEETPFEAMNGALPLRGVIWRPVAAPGPTPLAVIIAGSGPTDRDGNSALGLNSDAYRQLAVALAARGVATLRYDKRGVGASGVAFDPAALTIDDFVADARAVVAAARGDGRFSKLSVIGHSEGGLVALLLARSAPPVAPDALVLAATAGRPLGALLREQLASKLDSALMAEVERLLAALSRGGELERVPPALSPIFHRGVARFLASELELDPAELVSRLAMPVAIVQGDTDLQVTVDDARLLAAARPEAQLTIVPNANHLFKEEAERAAPQRSYTDPARPISPAIVEAIAKAIAR